MKTRENNPRNICSIFGTDASGGDWQGKRRAEVLNLYESIEFGTMPDSGYTVHFNETTHKPVPGGGGATCHVFEMTFTVEDNTYAIPFTLLLPAGAGRDAPCPAVLFCYGYENNAAGYAKERIDLQSEFDDPFWPARAMLNRGYAAAAFYVKDVESDNAAAFPSGLVRFFNSHAATAGCTGRCIAAWAFAARHIVAYLAGHPAIHPGQVAVAGHSRGGKTALWCGATEEHVAATFANCSGCGGASLSRGTSGERVGQITTAFPHWLCPAYAAYAGREEELPFDQHMLLGLVAPRLLYTTSGSEDAWNDPEGEFLGTLLASEAWRQYGLEGLGTTTRPGAGQLLHAGNIGYHMREGGHDLTLFDWMRFLDFFDKHRQRGV